MDAPRGPQPPPRARLAAHGHFGDTARLASHPATAARVLQSAGPRGSPNFTRHRPRKDSDHGDQEGRASPQPHDREPGARGRRRPREARLRAQLPAAPRLRRGPDPGEDRGAQGPARRRPGRARQAARRPRGPDGPHGRRLHQAHPQRQRPGRPVRRGDPARHLRPARGRRLRGRHARGAPAEPDPPHRQLQLHDPARSRPPHRALDRGASRPDPGDPHRGRGAGGRGARGARGRGSAGPAPEAEAPAKGKKSGKAKA